MPTATDYVREFQRAAAKRREAARILCSHQPAHFTDAVYLAGYTAECMLKALWLRSIPKRVQPELIADQFRGQRGHNLVMLWEQLQKLGVSAPRNVRTAVRRVSAWTTDIRYRASEFDPEEATDFLAAVDTLTAWVKGRLE